MRKLTRLFLAAVAAVALAMATMATSSATPAQTAATSLVSGWHAPQLGWRLKATGSTERFRGLAAVSRRVAWVSGTNGTVLRTTDAGKTWASVGPPGAETLQFRDIEATSASHAVILSIGEGTDSRIYVTDDGGQSWTESFRNTDPAAFYDCVAFTSRRHGVAVSDPVGGTFRLIQTRDAGHSWHLINPAGMPGARPGEAGFAASGTCLTAGTGQHLYLGSGGVDPGRVFTSADGGEHWTVADTPIAGGPASGVFSVVFGSSRHGIAVGGDYTDPSAAHANAAWSSDGGKTWRAPWRAPAGYRSGAAWISPLLPVAIAVGPTGSDLSFDGGRAWWPFDHGSFDGVQCTPDLSCWASGEDGRVGVLDLSTTRG